MDEIDKEIAEVNGAATELDHLVDFLNSNEVNGTLLRKYINTRLVKNEKRLKKIHVQVHENKQVFGEEAKKVVTKANPFKPS